MIENFPANKEEEQAMKRGYLEGGLARILRECREEFGDVETAKMIKQEFETITKLLEKDWDSML